MIATAPSSTGETGIWDALQPLLMHNGCESVTRDVALQAFGMFETRQESETPDMLYPEVLTRVHPAIAGHFGLDTTSELDEVFGRSVALWPAFADTADALRILKRHYQLVILSNIDRDGFAASNRKLGVEFDAIYTAQDIGSYKPNAANFEYLLSHLRDDLGDSRARMCCTLRRVCITTTCRLKPTGWLTPGLTANGFPREGTGEPPLRWTSIRIPTFFTFQ